MGIGELILIALALSMDAFAVGMTNGMTDSKMRMGKMLIIAAFYGFFQFLMPLIGYFSSVVFSSFIERIAPWLSFILLSFIGGKMLWDGVKEVRENKNLTTTPTHAQKNEREELPLNLKTLTAQAVATSIDALAVGVTFLALDVADKLCLNIWLNCLIIGAITFILSVGAVFLGKLIGDKFSDKAQILGGAVLIIIGLKILIEGIF